jgi:hypothetical protein
MCTLIQEKIENYQNGDKKTILRIQTKRIKEMTYYSLLDVKQLNERVCFRIKQFQTKIHPRILFRNEFNKPESKKINFQNL